MKKTSIGILLLVVFAGCRNISCPAFDFTHSAMQWHWFPGNLPAYEYRNEGSASLLLMQTKFEYNAAEERRCHYCSCSSTLDAYYDFTGIGVQLRSFIAYGPGANGDGGSLYFGVDSIGSPFAIEEQGIREEEVPAYEYREFLLRTVDTLEVIHQTYFQVVELEIIDPGDSPVRKLWLVPGEGIVGLELEDGKWERL